MSSDLPQIRAQLKKKLPKLLKDGDTLSIVWFSGLGQFGALIEAEPVATLGDLAVINTAIDRWLRPVGMTGFKEPLIEVESLVKRSKKEQEPVLAVLHERRLRQHVEPARHLGDRRACGGWAPQLYVR